MRILITGSDGFIGKNLIASLRNNGYNDLLLYNRNSNDIKEYLIKCDFIFHLAGVNRPDNNDFSTNVEITERIINILKSENKKVPIVFTSSIQVEKDNEYGKSKLKCEEILLSYSKETDSKVFIYRLQNVFGKWCKPGYNSVIATLCYNRLNGLPIILNGNLVLNLVYIDDVISSFINTLNYKYCEISTVYNVELKVISDVINSFYENIDNCIIPDLSNDFIKKLYSTFISYLPVDRFRNELQSHNDYRGSFIELLKSNNSGQISVNIIKPNIIKGNHWHKSKFEKFIVISGNGIIRLRKYNSSEVLEYYVSGSNISEVYIPCGYVHSIKNLGDKDLVFIIWTNEIFDKNNQDTYFQEV